MKFKKSRLQNIFREELARHVRRLREAPDVSDADEDQGEKEKQGAKKPMKPQGKMPQTAPARKPEDGPDAAKFLQKKAPEKAKGIPPEDVDPETGENPPEEKPPGEKGEDKPDETGVAKDVVGKSLQSITMDPKSKVLPGATEITLTFKETTDPLRILVTSSGGVKFFYRNALRNHL